MAEQFIRESFDNYLTGKKDYQLKISNHIRLLNVFSNEVFENADSGAREDVIKKIQSDDYEQQNPASFKTALEQSKHTLMLSNYTEQDFAKMKLFKLNGYNIGFALKQRDGEQAHDEIVTLFNNEPGVKGIGDILVQSAVKNGGRYLDHFDGFLSDLYKNNNFVQYNRKKYNPDYDEEGKFKQQYGESDVIYRKYDDNQK